MSRGQNRRAFVATTAAALLAGCNTSNSGNYDDDGNGGEDTGPQYDIQASIPSNADFTNQGELEFELYVERTLDGETEKLDDLEINGENIRNHPEYGEEVLEEAGLYQEIDLEQLDDQLWRIQKTDLIAGNTQLNLEISFEDTEYNHEDTYRINEELSVEKTQEETRQDIQVDNPKLWKTLRAEYVEKSLRNNSFRNTDTHRNWMEIAETVEQEIDFSKDTEGVLEDLSYNWATHASNAVDGMPSGQTEYLAHTIEYISHTHEEIEELHAHVFRNTEHSTAGAYNQEKMWDVESLGTLVATPPKEGNRHQSHPEQTSLMNPERWPDLASVTVRTMIDIQDPETVSEIREENENYFSIGENARLEILEHMRETETGNETGRLPDHMLKTMRNYAVSSALSPSIQQELAAEDLQ